MPKMNGFQLYKIIKQIDPKVKVCLMTAFEIMATSETRAAFEELEPPLDENAILKKPFDSKGLFSKVSQILTGYSSATRIVTMEQDSQILQK
jgi:CheY-like chemotaxis protein